MENVWPVAPTGEWLLSAVAAGARVGAAVCVLLCARTCVDRAGAGFGSSPTNLFTALPGAFASLGAGGGLSGIGSGDSAGSGALRTAVDRGRRCDLALAQTTKRNSWEGELVEHERFDLCGFSSRVRGVKWVL